jgi:hypothetical protein
MVFQLFECYQNNFSIHSEFSIPFPSQNKIPCDVNVSETNERQKYNQEAKKKTLQFPVLSPIPVFSLPNTIGCHEQGKSEQPQNTQKI